MLVILGPMTGHVLFNAKDAIVPALLEATKSEEYSTKLDSSESMHETEQPSESAACCSSPQRSYSSTNHDRHARTNLAPEGSTPCCQHTLRLALYEK